MSQYRRILWILWTLQNFFARVDDLLIDCKHWRKDGRCIAGVLHMPSVEFCEGRCRARTSLPNPFSIDGISDKQSWMVKVWRYFVAELSLLTCERMSEKKFNARMDACRTCDGLVKSDDPVGHCGKCGCGMSSRASLTVKGRMPMARCPLDRWKQ